MSRVKYCIFCLILIANIQGTYVHLAGRLYVVGEPH